MGSNKKSESKLRLCQAKSEIKHVVFVVIWLWQTVVELLILKREVYDQVSKLS